MITAGEVAARAAIILQDTLGTRWPESELIEWVNDAQREVILIDRTASAARGTITLDETDTVQSLPADGIALVDVIRTGEGRAVRQVQQGILDAMYPEWHAEEGDTVLHYVYSTEHPLYFYVHPKASGTLDILYTKEPTVVSLPTDLLTVDDRYFNAVLDFVLYRAYLKDAEATANFQLSDAAYKRFSLSMNFKLSSEAS